MYILSIFRSPHVKYFLFVIILLAVVLISVFLYTDTQFEELKLEQFLEDTYYCAEGSPNRQCQEPWRWSVTPRIERGNDWTDAVFMIPWAYGGHDCKGDPTNNTRVHIKDMGLYVKTNGKWIHTAESDTIKEQFNHVATDYPHCWDEPMSLDHRWRGETYIAWRDELFPPAPSYWWRLEDEGTSYKPALDWHVHPFPGDGTGRTYIEDTIGDGELEGVVAYFRAKLIVDNPSLPDDRDQARFVMVCGADYKPILTPGQYGYGLGVGRYQYVTKEWKTFYATSIPWDELKENPPPIFDDSYMDETFHEQVVHDHHHNHEGLPQSLPNDHVLKYSPEVENGHDTSGMGWMFPFGIIENSDKYGNKYYNAKVHIRNIETYILEDGAWKRMQNTNSILERQLSSEVEDIHIVEVEEDEYIIENEGFSLKPRKRYGHKFWCAPVQIPVDIDGIHVRYQVRLETYDLLRPDVLEKTRYIACAGAEFGNFNYLAGRMYLSGIGRFRYVTPEWNYVTYTSLNEYELKLVPEIPK